MDGIDFLPTLVQALLIVIGFAGLTVGGLYLVRRTVEPESLRMDHDVAGFTFGVIGAFYGVVLAFVIVAVWQRFERANDQVQAESLAVSNLYNLAQGLGEPMRAEMRRALRSYTSTVLVSEWQEMSEGRFPPDQAPVQKLWEILLKSAPANAQEQVFLDKSIDQITQLSDLRRLRYVYYSEDLPSVIWIVIYVGCVITLGFSYFFVTRRFQQQALMCGTFAALIGLTILAISELATPYQGAVVVSNSAFRVLAQSMGLPAAERVPADRDH
ncbi:MAG TPA: DUF4239 domain-containing protein [Candidatus Binataceae bacterium]|nr:DUF4239 domain-containing protein [Candidatus Binataceae bacterium]